MIGMKPIYLTLFIFIVNTSIAQPETFSAALNSLSGKELRAVISQFSVATIIFRNTSGNVIGYGGFMYEQLHWIALQLNFSLEMLVLENGTQGHTFNGMWTEMRQMIRREVDIACNGFSGLAFDQIIEQAVLVASDGFGILTPYPSPTSSKYSPILIFSRNVWITLIASIAACIGFIQLMAVLAMKYFQRGNVEYPRGLNDLSDISMYVFATLTNHGRYFQSSLRSVGIVAAVWCFATFVFVNIYSSCLTSYMSLVFQRPEINSFQELTMKTNYELATFKGGFAETMFLEAKSGTWKEIGDRLRHCPENQCTPTNMDHAAKRVLEGNFVAILPASYIDFYMSQTFLNGKKCLVTMAQETMGNRHYFMAVKKNNILVNELNKASFWWHAFGLQAYWGKKTERIGTQCRLKYNGKGESIKLVDRTPIKLEQLCVAFYILLIGYVVALIQFIRERFMRLQ